ncbi:endolytic transglycosylase MltG [bacterium]|nr:endolytic transglycosylase MltG [bacterium]
MKDRKVNKTLWAALVIIIILSFIAMWLHRVLNKPMEFEGSSNIEVVIEKGMNLSQVSSILQEKGLIKSRSDFRWAAWLMQAESKIQPGRFLLPMGVSNSDIIRFLLKPGILTRDVTIPEGLTVRQIAGIFKHELQIDSVEFISLCEDSAFAVGLGLNAGGLEGYLFPDTYNFYMSSSSSEIISRMVDHFFNVFNDSLQNKATKVGLNLHKAVILASIIQGEVMIAEEAPLVSAVYHNRLKRGIALGADPTIQYILKDGPRRLLNKDLEIDSPYNTYKRRGLPPGPVNNPGTVALKAAVNPADVKYIYFVAKGDGSHSFNTSHEGHQRDKAKFQQVRRKVAREKRNARLKGGE